MANEEAGDAPAFIAVVLGNIGFRVPTTACVPQSGEYPCTWEPNRLAP